MYSSYKGCNCNGKDNIGAIFVFGKYMQYIQETQKDILKGKKCNNIW